MHYISVYCVCVLYICESGYLVLVSEVISL